MSEPQSEAAALRAQWLRREIERHNALYYDQARPEISDQQFDALSANFVNTFYWRRIFFFGISNLLHGE